MRRLPRAVLGRADCLTWGTFIAVIPKPELMNDDSLGDGLAIRAGGAPEYVLRLGPAWFSYVCRLGKGSK